MIYFIADLPASRVKIGLSADPWIRFNKIQADSPGVLSLLAVIDGGAEREAALHTRFAEHRTRGEWFDLSPAILAFIEAEPKCERAGPSKVRGAWGAAGLNDAELSRLVGVAASTLNRIRHGKCMPSLSTATKIVKHAGVTYDWLAAVTGASA